MVGGGNSGFQIAAGLAATHRVGMAVGRRNATVLGLSEGRLRDLGVVFHPRVVRITGPSCSAVSRGARDPDRVC